MVEWKKLGEICEIGTGANNREDACDDGLYPFFVRSQEVRKHWKCRMCFLLR